MSKSLLMPPGPAAAAFAFSGPQHVTMLSHSELQRELSALLNKVDRLAPTHASDPERWHNEKSELRRSVTSLIEKTGGCVPRSPTSFCAPVSDDGMEHIRFGGRSIPVQRRR